MAQNLCHRAFPTSSRLMPNSCTKRGSTRLFQRHLITGLKKELDTSTRLHPLPAVPMLTILRPFLVAAVSHAVTIGRLLHPPCGQQRITGKGKATIKVSDKYPSWIAARFLDTPPKSSVRKEGGAFKVYCHVHPFFLRLISQIVAFCL